MDKLRYNGVFEVEVPEAERVHDCTKPKDTTLTQAIDLPGGEEWGIGQGERVEAVSTQDLRDRNRRSGGHNVA